MAHYKHVNRKHYEKQNSLLVSNVSEKEVYLNNIHEIFHSKILRLQLKLPEKNQMQKKLLANKQNH